MKVKNISPKLSARANYTFSGMTILQHEPAAAPKKVFLPCVSLPRANFYENIFYNAFALMSVPVLKPFEKWKNLFESGKLRQAMEQAREA